MMSSLFRAILLVGVLIFILLILFLMRKGRMSLKYSLIWLLAGIVLLLAAIFPQMIRFFTRLIGVYSEVNAVFFVGVCFLLLIILSLTSIASGQTDRIRTLVQQQAMLEKRIRDLEEAQEKREEKQDGNYTV